MNILMVNVTKMVNDTGGLAKVTCAFSNEMIKRGHDVSLIYTDEIDGDFFYEIDDRLKIYNLNRQSDGSLIKFPWYLKILREVARVVSQRKARGINLWFQEKYFLNNLRKYIDEIKPDIIVSYQPFANKMLLCDLNIKIPVVTMAHINVEDYFQNEPKRVFPAFEKSAINQVLVHYDEKIMNSRIPKAKMITIGNAIPQFDFQANLEVDKSSYKIIFVGRLAKGHKQPHLLIEAFSKLADKYPNWQVELWGAKTKKSYYKELEYLIKTNKLTDRVFLKGTTNDVPSQLKEADIFAFPSAFEGFGMALVEAMSAGLPAVGFRSCTAVNELIQDGKTGFVCADGADAFAEALEKLMCDKNLRVKMGNAAKVDAVKFAPENIWNQWEGLLKNVKKC